MIVTERPRFKRTVRLERRETLRLVRRVERRVRRVVRRAVTLRVLRRRVVRRAETFRLERRFLRRGLRSMRDFIAVVGLVVGEVGCQLIIVNRASPNGSQRWYISNVSDTAHGVHVVDFEQECIGLSANTIERHRSNLLALVVVERRKISGEADCIQFRLADGKSHLRRGAYAVNAM